MTYLIHWNYPSLLLWVTAQGCKKSQGQNQMYSLHPTHKNTNYAVNHFKQTAKEWVVVLCVCWQTSGLASSRSVLLGYIFCAIMMSISRSEVTSVLALRLENTGLKKRKIIFHRPCNPMNFVKMLCYLFTWSRRQAVWYEPRWRHAAPLLLLSPHCCWAVALNAAPKTLCTVHIVWGVSVSRRPATETCGR